MQLKPRQYALKLLPLAAFLMFLPQLAFAINTPQNVKDILYIFIDGIALLVPVVFALCVLAFFWGLARFILSAGSEEKVKEGKQIMFWGIVALFVFTSIWGIVGFLTHSVGFTAFGIPQLPQ